MKVQHVLFSALCAFALLLLLQACIPPCLCPDPGPVTDATYWSLSGNAGTSDDTEFLGTTDNKPLNLRVNNTRALRLEPNTTSPNVIGGYGGNTVTGGVFGATISGGGKSGWVNQVTAHYGTVGGGQINTASNLLATIGGGSSNTASGQGATVGGGGNNTASGLSATVPGGYLNAAGGGYSFAAGRKAKANHGGSFVWADSSADADLSSTAADQFLIRAAGGVGIGKNNPATALDVNGTVTATAFVGSGAGLTNLPGGDGHSLDAADGDPVDVVYVDNAGNVGIGTTSSGAKLEVVGEIKGFGIVPIGTILPWHKSFTNTPALPSGWLECNGQTVSDPASPYNGQTLPDLNGQGRFLRGSTTSGILQDDAFQGHWHTFLAYADSGGADMGNANWGGSGSYVTGGRDPITDGPSGNPRFGNETRPINMSVVWIMRVK